MYHTTLNRDGQTEAFSVYYGAVVTNKHGSLAQLVEQRPEEPRVPSSSLGGATIKTPSITLGFLIGARSYTLLA